MGGKLSNSFEMIKASANVLRSDKELIVFTIISYLAVGIISISFALPIITGENVDKSFGIINETTLPLLLLYYFLIYFVISRLSPRRDNYENHKPIFFKNNSKTEEERV